MWSERGAREGALPFPDLDLYSLHFNSLTPALIYCAGFFIVALIQFIELLWCALRVRAAQHSLGRDQGAVAAWPQGALLLQPTVSAADGPDV